MASQDDKQGFMQLNAPIASGEDEWGEFDVVPLSMIRGGPLKPFRVYRKPMRHIINDSNPTPRGWYKDKHAPGRQRPRTCYTEAILSTPYGGFCHVGCKFCYISGGIRGYRATGLPTVSPRYPDVMAKRIKQMMISGAFYISSFAEPFQKLEDTYHITQRLTDVLVEENLPFFYLSRRIPPDWAIEALQANPYSYMQWSINTSNSQLYKRLSPGSYTIPEVMRTMNLMARKGIYISIQCNPVLPGIIKLEEILDLVQLIADNGGRHIIVKFEEEVTGTRSMMLARLRRAGLEGVEAFESMLNQLIGGVYTIQQEIRVDWLNTILNKTRECGITMATCYEYYDDGGPGSNMAPYFTTSDQCHGRGIPLHFRPGEGLPFEPLPGCYRKGCLYCEEHGTHACGNEVLQSAKALRYADYKSIHLVGRPSLWRLEDSCARPRDVAESPACNPDYQTDMEYYDHKH